jgi:hypothetical protein
VAAFLWCLARFVSALFLVFDFERLSSILIVVFGLRDLGLAAAR